MTRSGAYGFRAVATAIMLLVLFSMPASAQWTGSGGAWVDQLACGEGRWENGVYHQEFRLVTTVQPTGDPRYYAALSPVQINTGFYYSTTTPYVQSSYNGVVTLSYTAGSGFGYGNPPVGSTVHYFITGAVMDSTTGGAVSAVSYREAFCVVPAPPAPTPVPTPTNTPEPTPTNTPEPTPTNTPVPTPTNTPEPTPTNTPVPTPTNTPEPTPTNTPVPTATMTPEPTATQTPEPTATLTPEPTATTDPGTTPSPTVAATSTVVPTATSEPGVTPSPTDQATATSTAEPVLTPTSTAGETPTVPPAQETITVRIAMPNGENIEGAPWDLYAPMASQAAIPPYLSGVVGPDNTIELVDLPHGQYRLVVRPAGMAPLELMVTSDGTSRDIVLQAPEAPSATGTVAQQTEVPAQPATSAATSTAAAGPTVAAFPSTGAGGAGTMPMMVLISAACIVTVIMSAFVLRRSGE